MRISSPSTAPDFYASTPRIRGGVTKRDSRILMEGEEGTASNYKWTYTTDEGGKHLTLPRHHHTFDQIRYMIEGSYTAAHDRNLPAGWVGYFPESVFYGPQDFEERRTDSVLQFGGPSGLGYFSLDERKRGIEGLAAKGGAFEHGMYVWIDENNERHQQDAYEAVWEFLNGRELRYPPPCYDDFILMNPENFDWVKDDQASGVRHKSLGTFTERDVRVGFVQVDEGASWFIGTYPSTELAFVTSGAFSSGGESHGRLSAFATSVDDRSEPLLAIEPTELFYVKLPTF